MTLQWRHNDHDCVLNHQPHGCLHNRLLRRRSKKTSKLRVTGLCVGNSPGPVNSLHKRPVTRKMFPFDDVIMKPLWNGRAFPLLVLSEGYPLATGFRTQRINFGHFAFFVCHWTNCWTKSRIAVDNWSCHLYWIFNRRTKTNHRGEVSCRSWIQHLIHVQPIICHIVIYWDGM